MDAPQSNDQIHAQIGNDARNIIVGSNNTQIHAEHLHLHTDSTPAINFDWAEVETRYRDQVVKYYNKLSLTGLSERDPGLHELTLENIFVKLNIELPQTIEQNPDLSKKRSDLEQELHNLSGHASNNGRKQEIKLQLRQLEAKARHIQMSTYSVPEALRQHRHLVIIGGPGSGKTTLTRWLTVVFARGDQAKADNLGIQFNTPHLPILLELRRFAEHFLALSQRPTVPDLATEIATFITQHAYYPDIPAVFIQRALSDGRCLLLFDGLDEIPDLGARQTLVETINAFLQHPYHRYQDNIALVTSRPHGYEGVTLTTFQSCNVKPFTVEDVKLFIHRCYAIVHGDWQHVEATELIDAIQANSRVAGLATNPLLCTIIAIVYRNNRILPSRRIELYHKCCEVLLDTWERKKAIKDSGLIGSYDWQTKLKLLAPVAFWLHSETERSAAPEEMFIEQLAKVLSKEKQVNAITASQEAYKFISAIRDRSGLLQGRGDGTLEFTHLTFQEYLAARHIASQGYPDYIDLVMIRLHEAWWREVHLLVIGHLGSNSVGAVRASTLILAILNQYKPPWLLLRSVSFLATFSREFEESTQKITKKIEEPKEWVKKLEEWMSNPEFNALPEELLFKPIKWITIYIRWLQWLQYPCRYAYKLLNKYQIPKQVALLLI